MREKRWKRTWPCRFITSHFKSACLYAHFYLFVHSKWPPLLPWRGVSWQRRWATNIPVLTDRYEPPPDLPHSHLNNERRAGVMSNLSVQYRRDQASIARQESRPALACWKSPQVLRNCPGGCMVGIKSLGLTELLCLCVNMPKVLSVTLWNLN